MNTYMLTLRQRDQALVGLLSPQQLQDVQQELDRDRPTLQKRAIRNALLLPAIGFVIGAGVVPLLEKNQDNLLEHPDRLGMLLLIFPVVFGFQYWEEQSKLTLERRIKLMEECLGKS